MYRILLVDDDDSIIEIVSDYFSAKSNSSMLLDISFGGDDALDKIYENSYDLLVLDVMLPEVNGFEICKEVRRFNDVPIIFITARESQEYELNGYAIGCDDYIIKPFSLPVLFKKTEALIKRSKGLVCSPLLSAGNIEMIPDKGIVKVNGDECNLTSTEFSILKILLENKGKIISRERLFTKIWGFDSDKDERVVNSHIKNLRKALGSSSVEIKTVVGRGYKIGE